MRNSRALCWLGCLLVVGLSIDFSIISCVSTRPSNQRSHQRHDPDEPLPAASGDRPEGEYGPPKPPMRPIPTQREKAREKLDNAANAVGWIAGLCAVCSVITLIASFVFSWVPTKLSIACMVGAAVGWVLQYALLVYGVAFAETAFWLVILVCMFMFATVVIPWVLAFKRKSLLNVADGLKAGGDLRAATAVIVTALPEKFPTTVERKELLVQMHADTGTPLTK